MTWPRLVCGMLTCLVRTPVMSIRDERGWCVALLMWLLARFKEPSSWGGLSMMLALAGINLPEGSEGAIAQILAGVAALAAVLLPDKGRG